MQSAHQIAQASVKYKHILWMWKGKTIIKINSNWPTQKINEKKKIFTKNHVFI